MQGKVWRCGKLSDWGTNYTRVMWGGGLGGSLPIRGPNSTRARAHPGEFAPAPFRGTAALYRVVQKSWRQVERKVQPVYSQPRAAMPGWCLTKHSLFYTQRCILSGWPVTATITLWTKSIEQIWLNIWSNTQNQTPLMDSLTNSYWPKLNSPRPVLNIYLFEQIPVKQRQANQNLTQGKPQWIQTIWVRVLINFHTHEECRVGNLAPWPKAREILAKA